MIDPVNHQLTTLSLFLSMQYVRRIFLYNDGRFFSLVFLGFDIFCCSIHIKQRMLADHQLCFMYIWIELHIGIFIFQIRGLFPRLIKEEKEKNMKMTSFDSLVMLLHS